MNYYSNIINCIIIFFIFFSNNEKQQYYNFNEKMILGKWLLKGNEMNYPGLEFKSDCTAVFYSRLDTVYRFHYNLKQDSLLLTDIYNNQFYGTIAVLNDSSLIFSKLIEHDQKQVYKKK